jgi:hypothetical protein
VTRRELDTVTFDPIDVQAVRGGATARRLEQLVCEVVTDDLGVRRCGAEGKVAGARRDVEHFLSTTHVRLGDEVRDGASSIISATAAWFPPAQVARWTRLRSATVGIAWIFFRRGSRCWCVRAARWRNPCDEAPCPA